MPKLFSDSAVVEEAQCHLIPLPVLRSNASGAVQMPFCCSLPAALLNLPPSKPSIGCSLPTACQLRRLSAFFETVRFAQRVFFGTYNQAAATIASITRIHHQIEEARGTAIPEWAYRDVLFLLIDYGERAHTIIYGPMSTGERLAHFEALLALGHAMELPGLPTSHAAYQAQRHQQLLDDYAPSALTERLFASYRAAL